MRTIILVLALVFAIPGLAAAQPPPGISSMGGVGDAAHDRIRDHFHRQQSHRWGLGSHPGRHLGSGVPELDPRAGGAALILVAGGVLVMAARRRRLRAELV